ncbi:MAG: conjugal transfer protein TraX [Lachnospiraceae bacterium]|nr:conjugal transfer protein TraX [Lachnospiraceae bacterium]
MELKNNLPRSLSCNILKLIACVCMLTDHIGFGIIRYFNKVNAMDVPPDTYKAFSDAYDICNGIGRLAFPIFAFFVVEGFLHTRDVKKYALRLFIFGLVSEIPFDLGLFKEVYHPDHQNVIFTFFIAVIMLSILKYLTQNAFGLSKPVIVFICICTVIAFADLALVLKTDYSWKCMLLVSVLYMLRSFGDLKYVAGAAAVCWEKYAPASFMLLYFYDPSVKPRYKYAFYVFYPLHLLIIYFVSTVLVG